MTSETIVAVAIAILTSTAVSSVLVAFIGRKKDAAEIEQIESTTSISTAEAFDSWLTSNVRLQEQREKDLKRYEEKLENAKTEYQREMDLMRQHFEKEMSMLRERIRALEKERQDLLLQNYHLRAALEKPKTEET